MLFMHVNESAGLPKLKNRNSLVKVRSYSKMGPLKWTFRTGGRTIISAGLVNDTETTALGSVRDIARGTFLDKRCGNCPQFPSTVCVPSPLTELP